MSSKSSFSGLRISFNLINHLYSRVVHHYKTPHPPTYELVYKDLDLHTRYHLKDLQVTMHSPTPSLADRLLRPNIGEEASQFDWAYFKENYARYR